MDENEEKKLIEETYDKLESLSFQLIEERKKTSSYQEKIKQYEKNLSQKDENIQLLMKEKKELEEKLNYNNMKKPKTVTFNKLMGNILKGKDEEQKLKLEKEIKILRDQIYILNKKKEEDNIKFEQNKSKLQVELTKQNKDINDIKEILNKVSEENKKLLEEKENKVKLIKDEEIDFEKVKEEYLKYKEKGKLYEKNIEETKKKIEEKKIELKDKENELIERRDYLKNLAFAINQKEEEVKKRELTKKEFEVEKYDEKADKYNLLGVIFDKNKEKNQYEITVNYDGKNVTCYMLQTTLDPKENGFFDFNFNEDGIPKNLMIKTDDLLTKYFLYTYKQFYFFATKDLQKK
jgi:hypothetical protein